MPAFQRGFERQPDVLGGPTRAKLKTGAPDYVAPTDLEIEQVAEESKVGGDAEVGFTEMDEGGYVENRVRVEVDQLDLIEVEKAAEEMASRVSRPDF